MTLYVGLMSGTSMDGIDGVLVDFPDIGSRRVDGAAPLRVIADAHVPMPEPLRVELLALNASGADELRRAALASNALARLQADVVARLLAGAGLEAGAVRAVGSHGQTVRHRPTQFDGTGFTIQLNNGALLAELCGIDVVCDFRSRDVAAGGEGAPLVPPFHEAMFGGGPARAVLNLGGIANLTLLAGMSAHAESEAHDSPGAPQAGADRPSLRGFDCGPGNALMDHWCHEQTGAPFDDRGRWAASGRVDAGLLGALLTDPYFARTPPKSTGRDLFNADWLARALAMAPARSQVSACAAITAADVQATLLELTARTSIDALRAHAGHTRELLVCGGGAFNDALMARLGALWPGLVVATTDSAGLPAMQVEAAAFAWLARRFCERSPGNHPAVTGARGPRVLGALYPA